MYEHDHIIQLTKTWIDQFILKYSICPFAKIPVQKGLIRYWVHDGSSIEDGLLKLVKCFRRMISTGRQELSNGFLILPAFEDDFQVLLDFYDYGCLLLEDMNITGMLQIVPFHPAFQFDGESPHDPSNLTNSSPYPMIHILRVEEVSEAIDSHPDITSVPMANKKLLRSMSKSEIEDIRKLSGK